MNFVNKLTKTRHFLNFFKFWRLFLDAILPFSTSSPESSDMLRYAPGSRCHATNLTTCPPLLLSRATRFHDHYYREGEHIAPRSGWMRESGRRRRGQPFFFKKRTLLFLFGFLGEILDLSFFVLLLE